MCGIVGYIGKSEGRKVLLDSLKRLEYRGYDSAGLGMIGPDGRLRVVRCRGKIDSLECRLREEPIGGSVGIAHTRWATHGRPSDENAHPHTSGPFALVHNGIIENYATLKAELEREGLAFASETDTEVIVKLLYREWRKGKDFLDALTAAVGRLRGSFAIVALNEEQPDQLTAVRKDSPLILGIGEDACYLASDVPAILPYTRRVVYLRDEDITILSRDGYRIVPMNGNGPPPAPQVVDWNPVMAEKAGYRHFMLKEIHEQPRAIVDTFRSVVNLSDHTVRFPDFELGQKELGSIDRAYLVACGTSHHAAMVGKHMIEAFCGVPVEVDLASEFRYRRPLLDGRTLLMVISQSGETADTRAALQEGIRMGARCCAIVNVVGSSIARMARDVIHTHAGPEIGVASTKAFTTQVVALYLFAIYWASAVECISSELRTQYIQDLLELPGKIERVLKSAGDTVHAWAKRFIHAESCLYLARGILHPIALEGALKLKEISYIHAEGYAAGEMKHGPIALIDENMPVVVLVRQGKLYEKMVSNIQEVMARDGRVLALVESVENTPDEKLGPPENQLVLPYVSQWLAPVLFSVPLQLLAYHMAVLRGADVDQPRNLAKSVTVE